MPTLPPEPTQMDPPLELPAELRPLRYRRRYLRTVQLMDDAEPGNDAIDFVEPKRISSPATVVPFERSLRREGTSISLGECARSNKKLLKAISHVDLNPSGGRSLQHDKRHESNNSDSISHRHKLDKIVSTQHAKSPNFNPLAEDDEAIGENSINSTVATSSPMVRSNDKSAYCHLF